MEPVKAKRKPGAGGARPGAGRPKGSISLITAKDLLEQVRQQANGQDYEQILVRDFLEARQQNNTKLVVTYHNLILNKVMSTLAKIEVEDSTQSVEAKQAAFAAALAKFAGVDKDK